MQDLSSLSAEDKLFRLAIGLRMVIAETRDDNTSEQLSSYLNQFGI